MKKTIIIAATCIFAFAINPAHSQNWKVTGNSGTTPATNFIGTTDNVPLHLRTNNSIRMSISNTGNVGIGTVSPAAKLDVIGQVKITDGTQGAGKVLTSDGTGVASWQTPVDGSVNSWSKLGNAGTVDGVNFLGTTDNIALTFRVNNQKAGSIDPIYQNTFFGYQVGIANIMGSYNIGIGYQALLDNVMGAWNVAVGYHALKSNTGSTENIAIGAYALRNNTAGRRNVAVGHTALFNQSFDGNWISENVAVGYEALYNVDGFAEYTYAGSSNTGIGTRALRANIYGYFNCAVGSDALANSAFSTYNTAIGMKALYQTTEGGANTAVGHSALLLNTTGNFNTAVGINSGCNAGSPANNLTALGYGAGFVNSNSYSVEIGNTSVSWIGGEVGWSIYSDKRIKENIRNNVPGLSFISKLNPVTYNLNVHKQNEICGISDTNELEGKWDIEKIVQTGFIAQEVEQAAKELNYDFNGVQAPTGNAKLYSIQYASFVVPLVKAVQELNEVNSKLILEIENLKNENEIFKNEIENLKVAIGITPTAIGNEQSAILYQNSPNPFSEKTTIKYFIPESTPKAEIRIYSADGKEQKSFLISEKGNGQIEFNGNTLPAGIYNYILIVDGKAAGQRQMILTK